MDDLTQNQSQLFWRILDDGAWTTRRAIHAFGPKPGWQRLLDERYLREVHTVYGPVLALHRRRFEECRGEGAPYLVGPSSLADRAFQMDALAVLLREGYSVIQTRYKQGSGISAEPYTSQITSFIIQVPPHVAQDMADYGNPVRPYIYTGVRSSEAQRGYPRLYASISGGGIRLPQLKKLLKEYEMDTSAWGHPLLLGVPEHHELRAYLRSVEARRRQLGERMEADERRRNGHARAYRHRPLVRLIELPMPQLTTRSGSACNSGAGDRTGRALRSRNR